MRFRRIKFLRFMFFFMLVVVSVKLYTIQFKSGKQYSSAAALQQSRNRLVYKERGDIIDRRSIPFTGRQSKWKAILQPYTLINNPINLRTIAEIFGFSVENLKSELSKNMLPYIIDITPAQAKAISDSSISGISIIDVRVRYSSDGLAPHILGYVNDNSEEYGWPGKGISDYFEQGRRLYAGLADADNGFMTDLGYRIWNNTGREKLNIRLTLDYHLQEIVEARWTEWWIRCSGADGHNYREILAIASRPDFDPTNIRSYLNDNDEPLFNRAIGSYTPGSVLKWLLRRLH